MTVSYETAEDVKRESERTIALWLCALWIKKPEWLNRMPNPEEITGLLEAVEKHTHDAIAFWQKKMGGEK